MLERLCWVGWFSFRYLGQVFLRYLRNINIMNVAKVFEGLGPFFLELSAICELKSINHPQSMPFPFNLLLHLSVCLSHAVFRLAARTM